MSRTYCYHCSSKLQAKDERSWWCDACQQMYYDNAAAGAELVILNDQDEVVVTRRSAEPYKGKLVFPGGFVDFNETLEDAMYREVNEEVGLERTDLQELTYFGSYQTPYPWGKDTVHTVVAVYIARLRDGAKLRALDDVSEVKFVKPSALKPAEFADFHQHSDILEKIKKLLSHAK